MAEIKLHDLKGKSPTELLAFAEELKVENANSMRKQELLFAILKQQAANQVEIIGEGVVEVAAGWFRISALARGELSGGPGRHLCVAIADQAFRAEDRRHGRGHDPQPEGGRTRISRC